MFLAHSHAVILALDQAIGLLDDPTKLKMKMTTLVKMHVHQNPPIGSEYFEKSADLIQYPDIRSWSPSFRYSEVNVRCQDSKFQFSDFNFWFPSFRYSDVNLRCQNSESQFSDFNSWCPSFRYSDLNLRFMLQLQISVFRLKNLAL
ncbi:hypothetical protein PoB_003829600 [Plakobranchus ocellatus]|uniref:Uncharacterized protein n=1 Tax=Plakobranchus ocellatus TaxID=259542 RepID=A0AAV4AZ38_9GAST|nr:hypothetical protein PoB_003829600 [Plakobranchus ocellatus]